MSEDYWKNKLSDEQYYICRMKGTETPFTGKLTDNHEAGTYSCVACGNDVFVSDQKYDSGSGWPSFWEAAEPGAVKLEPDNSHGMERTEVLCSVCGSHLGHVFPDGPAPSYKRYCVNSAALEFTPKVDKKDAD